MKVHLKENCFLYFFILLFLKCPRDRMLEPQISITSLNPQFHSEHIPLIYVPNSTSFYTFESYDVILSSLAELGFDHSKIRDGQTEFRLYSLHVYSPFKDRAEHLDVNPQTMNKIQLNSKRICKESFPTLFATSFKAYESFRTTVNSILTANSIGQWTTSLLKILQLTTCAPSYVKYEIIKKILHRINKLKRYVLLHRDKQIDKQIGVVAH